jgi:hypothetical protein
MTTLCDPIAVTTTPKPGIYPDVSLRDYIAWDAVSSTILKAMRRSPAHAKYERENSQWSDALELGDATHLRILQPKKFPLHYDRAIQCQAMTQKGARCSKLACYYVDDQQLCSTHADDGDCESPVLLNDTKWNRVNGMRDAVRDHATAAILLADEGPVELSIVWQDTDTGLLCKARLDKVSAAAKSITDLKSTQDAEPEAFSRSIGNYGYDIQGAHYLCGAQAVGLDVSAFGFIAIESEAPHCLACYELDPEAIALGFKQQQRLLARYAECRESNHWPGYGEAVTRIGVTDWAAKQIGRRLSA